MIHAMKERIKLDRGQFKMITLALGGFFLVAQLAVLAIFFIAGSQEHWMGFIIGMLVPILVGVLFINCYYFYSHYDMAIRSGCTRWEYVVGKVSSVLLQTVYGILLTAGLLGIYLFIQNLLTPGFMGDFNLVSFLLNWQVPLIFAAAVCTIVALDYCIASVLIRFGKTGYVAMFGLYFILIMSAPFVQRMVEQGGAMGQVFQALLSLQPWVYIAIAVAILVGILWAATRVYLRGTVRE